jgi:hypothetical protein
MPLRLTIDATGTVVVLRARRTFTLLQWSAALASLAIHPRLPAPLRIIFDRRGTPIDDSVDFAWTMAAVIGPHSFAGSRWAVLVDGEPAAFGLARIFTSAQALQGIEAAVFRDPDSGLTWLLDGDQQAAEALLAQALPRPDPRWLPLERTLGEELVGRPRSPRARF